VGDTYSNLSLGRYNREAMAALDGIVDGILASTLAEPIESVDGTDPYGHARSIMEEKRFDVLGVSENNRVIGYIPLTGGDWVLETRCGVIARQLVHAFRQSVVGPSFRLYDALQGLAAQQRLFVLDDEIGGVAGIITRADLQKAPIRMLVFSYITLLEIHITEGIRRRYVKDAWRTKDLISQKKLRSAEREQVRRIAAGEDSDLLDCLDFFDKEAIVLSDSVSLAGGRAWPDDATELLPKVRGLRNAVAHGRSLANRERRWADVAKIVSDVRALNHELEACDDQRTCSVEEKS
jgi:CBS domain-containing protein